MKSVGPGGAKLWKIHSISGQNQVPLPGGEQEARGDHLQPRRSLWLAQNSTVKDDGGGS